jgi:hypothetical protein
LGLTYRFRELFYVPAVYAAVLPSTLLLSALLLASQVARADDPQPAAEDKPPALSLTIEGPVDAELAPVAGRLTELFYQCYPKLLARFENPKLPAPRKLRLVFDPDLKIPAYCSGDNITVGVKWLKQHPEDIGLFTHELSHSVQAYPSNNASWMTEGIADYARKLYGPAKQPGWNLPAKLRANQSYKDSYGTTARFLVWLDEKHPGTVDKLHHRMQEGKFDIDDFKDFTGKDVDTLWREYVQELDR